MLYVNKFNIYEMGVEEIKVERYFINDLID